MKKRNLIAIGALTIFALTGCGAAAGSANTEELQQQITQLEQQIADLEQQAQTAGSEAPAEAETPAEASESGSTENASQAYTYTLEELTAMVDDFTAKADAAAPGETQDKNLEQFFSLKQEENQLDDELDRHEDELEREYRSGNLSREEYRSLERELEKLEDQLDSAEDQLEYVFGIDD